MSESPKSLSKKCSIVILHKLPYFPKLNKNLITLSQKEQFSRCLQHKNNHGNSSFRKQAQESILTHSLGRVKTQNNIQMNERRENIKNKIKLRLVKQMEKCRQFSPKQRGCNINQIIHENLKYQITELSNNISIEGQKSIIKNPQNILFPLRRKTKKQTLIEKQNKLYRFGIYGKGMRQSIENEENEPLGTIRRYQSIQSSQKSINKKNLSELVRSANKKLQKYQNKYRSISMLRENQKIIKEKKQIYEQNDMIEPWNIEIYQ